MADDLKLEIVIQALLDAKGFEEAKQNLGNLTVATTKAGDEAAKAAPKQKGLSESYGGTRGPVADVTRVLLMNVGVTGAAGEAAKAAGTAMYFMEGAATAANVAIASGVAVIALLLPKIIEWVSNIGKLKDLTVQLNSDLDTNVGKIEKMTGALQGASAAAQNLIVALHAKAMDEDRAKLERMRAEVALYTENMRKLGQVIDDSPSIVAMRQQIKLFEDAHAKGLTYAESLEQIGKQSEITAVSLTEFNQEIQRQTKEAAEDATKALEQEIDAMIDMRRETDKQAKKAKDEAEREAKRQRDKKEADEEEARRRKEADEEKRINALNAVGYIGQTLTALSVLFKGNKALAIAGAIADTYAGAALALRTIPPPAGWAAAAATIAQGSVAVQNIRKAEPVGFDDPFADMTARKLGQKSAVDFVRNFAGGFTPGVVAGMGAMGGSTHNTTINRGTTINMGGIHGALGPRPAFDKWLERAMTKATRSRSRTTVGRS